MLTDAYKSIIDLEKTMDPLKKSVRRERPDREKVNREEALKRVKAFPKRKEKLIATIRKGSH